jgi:hypothetical protein
MLRTPKEEENSLKFLPTSPKALSRSGTTEVKRVIRRQATAKEPAKIVAAWAIIGNSAQRDPEK